MAEDARIGMLESVSRGASTAARSWPAIGVVVLVSLAWVGASSMVLRTTKFPQETLMQLREESRAAPGAVGVEDAAQPAAPADGEGGEAIEADAGRARTEQALALLRDWAGRAWPSLLMLGLFGCAGWVWTTGGQLGYLEARLTGDVSVRRFFDAGRQAFLPVLVTVLAMTGAATLALLGFGVLITVGQLLGRIGGLLASVLVLAGLAGLSWLAVGLVYWLIAAALDGRGPMEGLRASLHAVRGRWWRTSGLLGVWLLVGMGVGLCLQLVTALFARLGGVGATGAAGLELIVSVFLGFAVNGSLITWYRRFTPPHGSPAA